MVVRGALSTTCASSDEGATAGVGKADMLIGRGDGKGTSDADGDGDGSARISFDTTDTAPSGAEIGRGSGSA